MVIRNYYNIGHQDLWALFEELGIYKDNDSREPFDDITCEWISEDDFIRTARTIAADYPRVAPEADTAYYAEQLLTISEVMQSVGVA